MLTVAGTAGSSSLKAMPLMNTKATNKLSTFFITFLLPSVNDCPLIAQTFLYLPLLSILSPDLD